MNRPTLSATAGRELRAHLARQSLSIKAAADRLGHNRSWLQRRLDGSPSFNLDDIDLICTVLGIPVESLIPSANRKGPTWPS
jgi:hypothetical protein